MKPSIFELTEGNVRERRVLEFICSCESTPAAEELIQTLSRGFYYILPCYEVKDKQIDDGKA